MINDSKDTGEPPSGPSLRPKLAEGSLLSAIWTMSWPLMITTVLSSLIGMADLHVAGFLGAPSQAAVGVSEQIIFLFLIFIMSTGVGTQALVSRATGARDENEAQLVAGQSLAFAIALGLVLLCLSTFAARPILGLFTSAEEVLELSTRYLSIYGLYLIPFSVMNIVNASFRAIGDARTPLTIMLIVTVLNIAGDYLTVLMGFPVKGLAISGIAWSGVIAASFGAVLAILQLMRSPLRPALKKAWPPEKNSLGRILNIGIPSAFQRLAWGLSTFVVFFILSRCPEPTPALAAWTIGMRIEGLLFMPLMALGLGVASIVGQNLGAKQPERAVKAGWQVSIFGVGLMVVLGAMLYFFASQLSAVMTRDPSTIAYTSSYIKFNAMASPLLALGMILSSALQGAGDTRTPMWITYFTNWVLRLPLAWALAINSSMGPTGVWIAMGASSSIMGVITALYFNSKKWLSLRI